MADRVASPDHRTRAAVSTMVEKLRRIPDWARSFVETPETVRTRYLLRPALLNQLVAGGLPVRHRGGTPYFDRHDLMNCSLHLGTGAAARTARRFWPAALRQMDGTGRARFEITYQVRCPTPGHGPTCHYVFVMPGGRVVETAIPAQDGHHTRVEVVVDGTWPALRDDARALLDEVADLEFMMLPLAIRNNTRFIQSSGLSDCAGLSKLLVHKATARGLTARRSFGLIVAPPFAVEHFWAELRVADVWVPVDPVLIRTMVTWGVVDPTEWTPYRSIGAILTRIAGNTVVLAAHEGRAAPLTLPSRLLASEATG